MFSSLRVPRSSLNDSGNGLQAGTGAILKFTKIKSTMAVHGLINTESRYSVHETIDRLEGLLKSKGIKIFARLDQAAEAQAVGLSLRPTELLIFGDPKSGSPRS